MIPRGSGIYVDVLVRPDERIVIQGARRYLEPGVASFRRIWHLRPAADAETGVVRGRRFNDRALMGPDQIHALQKAEILTTNSKPREVRGSADFSATRAVAKLEWPDGALDLESDGTAEAATMEHS